MSVRILLTSAYFTAWPAINLDTVASTSRDDPQCRHEIYNTCFIGLSESMLPVGSMSLIEPRIRRGTLYDVAVCLKTASVSTS